MTAAGLREVRFRFDFAGNQVVAQSECMLPVAILAGGLATRLRPAHRNDPQIAGRDQRRAVSLRTSCACCEPAASSASSSASAISARWCGNRWATAPLRARHRLFVRRTRPARHRRRVAARAAVAGRAASSCSTAIPTCPATGQPSAARSPRAGKPGADDRVQQSRSLGHEQRGVRRRPHRRLQ